MHVKIKTIMKLNYKLKYSYLVTQFASLKSVSLINLINGRISNSNGLKNKTRKLNS